MRHSQRHALRSQGFSLATPAIAFLLLAEMTTTSAEYIFRPEGLTVCPADTLAVLSESDCGEAAEALGVSYMGTEDEPGYPNGCYQWDNRAVYFNYNTGRGESKSKIVCQVGATATTLFYSQFILHTFGSTICPADTRLVLTEFGCLEAAAALGFPRTVSTEDSPYHPNGCYLYSTGDFYFNFNEGQSNDQSQVVCELSGNATTSTTTTYFGQGYSGQGYILQTEGLTSCPSDTWPVWTISGCREAAAAFGLYLSRDANDSSYPHGCYMHNVSSELFVNYNEGRGNSNARVVCKEGLGANTTTTTTSSGPPFLLQIDSNFCPADTMPVLTEFECIEAAAAFGFIFDYSETYPYRPNGCYKWLATGMFYLNYHVGQASTDTMIVCKTSTPTVTLTPTVTPTASSGQDNAMLVPILMGMGGVIALLLSLWFVWQMCFSQGLKTQPDPAGGPVAVVNGGKATLRSDSKELVDPLNEMAMKSLPKYWTGCRESGNDDVNVKDDLGFDELIYVKHEHMEFFQDLINQTYRKITTQDRLCPTGKHDKTKGGCPCEQPGGDPGLPTGYQIKRVIRVEDSAIFSRYIHRRDQIKRSRSSCEAPDPEIFTRAAMEASNGLTEVLCDVDDGINEVYLWHGTQVRTGLAIAQDDFSLNFAGSGAGTMYGKGLYFSESCTKADEYAMDEPGGHYDGVRGLLLCRVCLGNFHYTLDREPSAIDKYTNGECDSTIGDRAKAVNTYREMVVYDRDQVYPEYLVLYERLHRGETPQLPPKEVPFLLELPLYWRNVGRNPYTEGFREHWMVKPMIRELIQRLANGSCGRDGAAPKVVLARRIEVHELDGNPESGHALTATILSEFHGDEAISVENMAPGLNETLLWHGTSQQAADAIAEIGFEVKKSGTHVRRFGHGVYLAEDLSKSLSYCSSSGNVKYVLLCRAVCGHMHYTEEKSHPDATSEAAKLGKHCVLANPERSGPREYIVLETGHVYPEYIVEFED
ncbi:Tnks [Symbiodinium sp. KB8]|nr:Tnks [Symbiodinium sp. KB8]